LVEKVECKPGLSVVVVVYNMAREAPRTLYTLSAAYQRQIESDSYEVIVVDNGSNPPFDPRVIDCLSGNFRLIRIDHASPSPAQAVNLGIAEARGEVIGVMVDGARMVTPGLLHFARHGASLYDRAVVASIGWFLGFDHQRLALESGYDEEREDALLKTIEWPADGYRLFEIGTLAGSSPNGWLLPIAESNALFLRRELWERLEGFDERFDLPGGGFVNLDTYRRALELPNTELVVLLGEGSFHQIHGGMATNSDIDLFPEARRRWAQQYETIRGRAWVSPARNSPTYLGTLPRPALSHLIRSALDPIPRGICGPLGSSFDRTLWSITPIERPADPAIAALVDLAHSEFRAGRFEASAAVARLARSHAPDEIEPQRLLAHAGIWLRGKAPPNDRRAEFHLALGKAYQVLGDGAKSASEYRRALTFDGDLVQAYMSLAKLRLPGDDYFVWLKRLHAAIAPQTYLEIGIDRGQSLSYARPPTRAVGVDPEPKIDAPLKVEAHLFCETSDVFFAERRLAPLLNDQPLALAFIDGLHVFQQSLKDFMHVESFCGPRSVVLIHDTIPLDELTQRLDRQRKFYRGDVWKTVLCLKHYRPDLDIFTIATPPTGLTVVTGLDSTSRILTDQFEEAMERFVDTSFAVLEPILDTALNVVPNDWSIVQSHLKERGIV
jgi:glycosyltransferase involved in cell wall biosynthesis/tetratricopeptide (TPR) repeat protein